MTDYQLLNVSGAASTSPEFRQGFSDMIARHGWNGDAIAAVISNESAFQPKAKNPIPGQTAVGLLQFIESTRHALGFTGTRDEFAALKDYEQLPYVEKYYETALGDGEHRPVDYYLATWGASAGLAMDHVLASEGDKEYSVNKSLDVNHDGQITVSDLDSVVEKKIASAGGVRLPMGKPMPRPAPLVPGAGPSSSAASLPVLRPGDLGNAVSLVCAMISSTDRALMLDVRARYDDTLLNAVRSFQQSMGLVPDGVVGEKTWAAFIAEISKPKMTGY